MCDEDHGPLLEDDSWACFLERWEHEVYLPVFQPAGISRDAALIVWTQNKTFNCISDYVDSKREDAGGDEPWRKK